MTHNNHIVSCHYTGNDNVDDPPAIFIVYYFGIKTPTTMIILLILISVAPKAVAMASR